MKYSFLRLNKINAIYLIRKKNKKNLYIPRKNSQRMRPSFFKNDSLKVIVLAMFNLNWITYRSNLLKHWEAVQSYFVLYHPHSNRCWGSLLGVVANALDCDTLRSAFKPHSRYYVHFHTKILGKCMIHLISTATRIPLTQNNRRRLISH